MNKLAVITGASAGMGAEFARQLAAQGYDLLLIARREERLRQLGLNCEILAADLTVDSDLARVEERLRHAPNLELLVNNAGFGTLGKFYKISLESQDKMHRLHVLATMRLCHTVLPGMVERDRGGIINVSSVAGFVYGAGSVSYCSTKAWMNRFTEVIYMELKMSQSKVRVQALCPGYTRTEFHEVVKMDTAAIPDWMWLPAAAVVRDSLAGFEAGKLFVVPGWGYRAFLRFYALLPRAARHWFGSRSSSYRKSKR